MTRKDGKKRIVGGTDTFAEVEHEHWTYWQRYVPDEFKTLTDWPLLLSATSSHGGRSRSKRLSMSLMRVRRIANAVKQSSILLQSRPC